MDAISMGVPKISRGPLQAWMRQALDLAGYKGEEHPCHSLRKGGSEHPSDVLHNLSHYIQCIASRGNWSCLPVLHAVPIYCDCYAQRFLYRQRKKKAERNGDDTDALPCVLVSQDYTVHQDTTRLQALRKAKQMLPRYNTQTRGDERGR